jgi:hypothetical protein
MSETSKGQKRISRVMGVVSIDKYRSLVRQLRGTRTEMCVEQQRDYHRRIEIAKLVDSLEPILFNDENEVDLALAEITLGEIYALLFTEALDTFDYNDRYDQPAVWADEYFDKPGCSS